MKLGTQQKRTKNVQFDVSLMLYNSIKSLKKTLTTGFSMV